MLTISVEVESNITASALNKKIAERHNPAPLDSTVGKALTGTGIVHFASMSVIDGGVPGQPKLFLLLELNADDTDEAALDKIVPAIEPFIGPIFEEACPSMTSLRRLLGDNVLEFSCWPVGATGLEYDGTGEFTVRAIQQQKDLADFARKALDHYVKGHVGLTGRAFGAIEFVRGVIRQDEQLVKEADQPRPWAAELKALLRDGKPFADALTLPTGNNLKFAQWELPKKWPSLEIAAALTKANEVVVIGIFFLLILFGLTSFSYLLFGHETINIHWNLDFSLSGLDVLINNLIKWTVDGVRWTLNGIRWVFDGHLLLWVLGGGSVSWLVGLLYWLGGFALRLLFALGAALFVELTLLLIIVGSVVLAFQAQEALDAPDDETPPLSTIETIAAVENAPGYAQNHFMSVTQIKPGLLRRLSLSVALFSIQLVIINQCRPGFVNAMGTIHYARWFRLPKTDKLIFLSNYDGSWESYLEDFITRVHQGQTAAWSNGVGFPRTRNLTEVGAEDGDRFKRWVRRQQQIAPFWYSRFPDLTTDHIRNNALIQHGLARAQNETAARAWLKCFGSMQRPDNTIEADEVQSLVFGAMGDLTHAALVVFQLPPTTQQRGDWLRGLMPETAAPGISHIRFGDVRETQRHHKSAAILAFSAKGLEKLGLSPPKEADGLGTFPGAFNMGMQARARFLGDVESKNWPWSDINAHAAMLIYWKLEDSDEPQTAASRDKVLNAHLEYLNQYQGAVLEIVRTRPTKTNRGKIQTIDGKPVLNDRVSTEHFGFRDNISQPIIRGAQSSFLGALTRDTVLPGEFIFGYPNTQGYLPPSPTVSTASDRKKFLPVPLKITRVGEDGGATSKPPNFDEIDPSDDWRDFGRNGTFVAIRQLEQKVKEFDDYTKSAAAMIAQEYPRSANTLGGTVDAEWVAAKLMGRWKNGTPLVFHPQAGPAPTTDDNRNDFAYGEMDPSGLKCPLGAHIRRANPRDSLHAGDPLEQNVTNRHRILRRGRSYETEGGEKGLVFVALCADLERQFELVQQTWINSPSFHGLAKEIDPIVGLGDASQFTIPTAAGPIILRDLQCFVEVKAGGYFFIPSRSALRYLAEL